MNKTIKSLIKCVFLLASVAVISGCPNEEMQANNEQTPKASNKIPKEKHSNQDTRNIGKDPQRIAPAGDNSKVSQATLKQQYSSLMELIADKSCDSDSHCRALPVGSRACGGPDGYEAYSTKNTNLQAINQLAQEYAAARNRYNQENQMASICSIELKPNVSCISNQCQKQSGRQMIQ